MVADEGLGFGGAGGVNVHVHGCGRNVRELMKNMLLGVSVGGWLTGMSVGAPTDLSSAADDVGEDIRRWPWVGVMKDGVDFVIGCVVHAETLLQKTLVDVGFEILGAFRAVGSHVIAQLVGKVFGRMRGISKDAGVPKVLRIRFMELYIPCQQGCRRGGIVYQEILRLAVASPPVSWSLVPTKTPSVPSVSKKSSTLANALSYARTSCTCATGSLPCPA